MELKELIAKRDELQARIKNLRDRLDELNQYIDASPDGFFYIERTSEYGCHHVYDHLNADSARRSQDRFYGDNGFSHVWTNNPDYRECYDGQSIDIVNCTKEYVFALIEIFKDDSKTYEDYKEALAPVLIESFDY